MPEYAKGGYIPSESLSVPVLIQPPEYIIPASNSELIARSRKILDALIRSEDDA